MADMDAWVVDHVAPIDEQPLRRITRELPEPGPRQVRIRVSCCGVCRTDLHLAEGDLPPHRPATTPGHEVVGRVDAAGTAATRFAIGDRVGVAWLGGTDGTCRYCRRGDENLCVAPTFTGWDVDGGYADVCLVDELLWFDARELDRLPPDRPAAAPPDPTEEAEIAEITQHFGEGLRQDWAAEDARGIVGRVARRVGRHPLLDGAFGAGERPRA